MLGRFLNKFLRVDLKINESLLVKSYKAALLVIETNKVVVMSTLKVMITKSKNI